MSPCLQQQPRLNFSEFKKRCYEFYHNKPDPHPAWVPTLAEQQQTNLYKTIQELNLANYDALYTCSITEPFAFWDYVIKKLAIKFKKPYTSIASDSNVENLHWLPNGQLNIVDSCFLAEKNKTAIIYQNLTDEICTLTYGDLEKKVNAIAKNVYNHFAKGDSIAIIMPMTVEAVAIYLGIIKAGCCVVAIADSFASEEIATRLNISHAKAIFTQDYYFRNQKKITLYEKIKSVGTLQTIVVSDGAMSQDILRSGDISFADFITPDVDDFDSIACHPDDHSTILFSSGTTGTPKAIPWTHTTPIKTAMDGHFHQDIQRNDIVAWATNLGWMMGPWLVYTSLINQSTLALSQHAPTQAAFGEFIEKAKVSILGLVPSMVSVWKTEKNMEAFDWSAIKCFSSSGECSSPEDYLYLMWLGNNKPIIEYCGGTEIGGAYLSSTLLQPNSPSVFTTPTLGIEIVLLDESQQLNTQQGEVALATPSIGLSQTLLNADHHQVYFADMPEYHNQPLRRHGDYLEKIPGDGFRAQGRVDDTMNLGGIKVSSAEIERVINSLNEIQESAAIAVSSSANARGPEQLVVFVVCHQAIEKKQLVDKLQNEIKTKLNPLFKLHDVVIKNTLPRTASNKIMRRVLRGEYGS